MGNHSEIAEWIIHGAIKTVIDVVGVMALLTIAVFSGADTKWIWPKSRHSDTTRWIRTGRFVHWIFVGTSGVILAIGAIVIGTDNMDSPWPALLGAMALAAICALLGRGLLYVLADE